MVQPEDRIRRRAISVGHGTIQTADRPVSARMEGRRVGDELEVAKVGEGHGGVDLGYAGEVAQRVVGEVAAETAGCCPVGFGLRAKQRG